MPCTNHTDTQAEFTCMDCSSGWCTLCSRGGGSASNNQCPRCGGALYKARSSAAPRGGPPRGAAGPGVVDRRQVVEDNTVRVELFATSTGRVLHNLNAGRYSKGQIVTYGLLYGLGGLLLLGLLGYIFYANVLRETMYLELTTLHPPEATWGEDGLEVTCRASTEMPFDAPEWMGLEIVFVDPKSGFREGQFHTLEFNDGGMGEITVPVKTPERFGSLDDETLSEYAGCQRPYFFEGSRPRQATSTSRF